MEDSFTGIVEHIGIRDIFYDLLSYELPNSCLSISEEAERPDSFECSLRLVGCQSANFEEKSWCDIF